jgi:hypothetical protein
MFSIKNLLLIVKNIVIIEYNLFVEKIEKIKKNNIIFYLLNLYAIIFNINNLPLKGIICHY